MDDNKKSIELEQVTDLSPVAQVVTEIIGCVTSICASEVVYLGIKALVPEPTSILAKMMIGFGSLSIGTWIGSEAAKASEQPVKEMMGAAVFVKAAILEEIERKKTNNDEAKKIID